MSAARTEPVGEPAPATAPDAVAGDGGAAAVAEKPSTTAPQTGAVAEEKKEKSGPCGLPVKCTIS